MFDVTTLEWNFPFLAIYPPCIECQSEVEGNFPNGIDVLAPLLDDMLDILRVYVSDVLVQFL